MGIVIGKVDVPITPGVKKGDLVELNDDVATQKIAVLGISGSGKTYFTGLLVEQMIEAGRQVVVIDTVGNWWGLRLSSNGKSPGLQIPILGGDHGDVALDPSHGRLVAETIAETRSSMVIDISDFTGGETRKFVIDLAVYGLAAKKRHPSPVEWVWEECQDIVPQKVFGEDARMVGAVQKLIKKGRNYGVGTILLSQRPAAVNKEALEQCGTLFGFRVVGKNDRKAIEDWITDHGAAPPDTAMSELDTGTCVLWSPQWLKRRDVVKIGKKKTFDASATPDFEPGKVTKLAPIDLDAFKIKMASAIAKADERDPDKLLVKIAELEHQIAQNDTGAMKPADAELLAVTEQRNRELVAEIERLRDVFHDVKSDLEKLHRETANELVLIGDHIQAKALAEPTDSVIYKPIDTSTARTRMQKEIDTALLKQQSAPVSIGTGAGRPDMSKMMRNMLVVLAQNAKAFPEGMPKGKVLTYANYSRSGNTGDAWAEASRAGYITATGGLVAITAAGLRSIGTYEPLPTGNAYYETILRALAPMEQKLMRAVHAAYPNTIAKGKALEIANYKRSGNTGDAWALLTRRDYIVKTGGGSVRASDHL